jgi:hypothetical protein
MKFEFALDAGVVRKSVLSELAADTGSLVVVVEQEGMEKDELQ